MTTTTSHDDRSTPVDAEELRDEVRAKYREVAETPGAEFHFHTGRDLARRLRYEMAPVDELPDIAVESFAGVANPFELRDIEAGERVVDIGSGAGFDSFLAAKAVGPGGAVIGVDMTPEMLIKSRSIADDLGFDNVEFREGIVEALPVDDGWADVVISNGVFNLCPDKTRGVRRGVPGPATGWRTAVRGHRQRPTGARRGHASDRLVDRLNCRWPAVCRLDQDAHRDRIRRHRDRRPGRHVRRSRR